ncbi:MAG: SDR family oxidoreductase [Ilumatobacteraceae bacterium]
MLLDSVFYGTKHAARVMQPQGSGSIISTSSTAGVMGGLGPHAYTACKHAVIGLTKSTAAELSSSGIRVNAIAPGSVASALTTNVITGNFDDHEAAREALARSNPLGFPPEPIDIANAALYLASDESRFVSGHTLVVDGGRTTNGGSGRFANSEARVIGRQGS